MAIENISNLDSLGQGTSTEQVPGDNAVQTPPVQENQNASIPTQTEALQPEQAIVPEVPKPEDKPTHEQLSSDAKSVLETAKLDSVTVEKEWFANGGKLNDETYDALEKAGISKDIVDNYGKMMQASQEQNTASQKIAYQTTIDSVTGGREKTVELIEFFNSGAIPSNEYQVLYQQLNSGEVGLGTAAINRLKTLYTGKYGSAGNPIQGMHATSVGYGDVFNSVEEAQLAFNATMEGNQRKRAMEQKVIMDKVKRTNKLRAARGESPLYG